MDERALTWMNVGRVAVEYCTRLQRNENALVVRDTGVRDYPGAGDLADAIFASARYVGAEISQVEYTPRSLPGEELPKVVGAAMAAADVIYLGPTMVALHATAVQQALAAGARLLSFTTADSASSTVGPGRGVDLAPRSVEEIEEIGRLTTRLAELFRGGGALHVTTPLGTDITCEIGKLRVNTMDAMYRGPGGATQLIPGLAGGGTTPGSTQGILVVDASITPIRRPLTSEGPIALHIKDGVVVSVDGGPAAREWSQRAAALNDPSAYFVAEFGFGCHPRARAPIGTPMEDERMYGNFHLGIGTNTIFGGTVQSKWHIDASATQASATLDRTLLVEGGVYRV